MINLYSGDKTIHRDIKSQRGRMIKITVCIYHEKRSGHSESVVEVFDVTIATARSALGYKCGVEVTVPNN